MRGSANGRGIAAALVGALLALAGCGDLTSGGVGEIEVSVAADSVELGALLASAEEPGTLEGTVSASLRVYVRRGLRDWVEVTDGEQMVTLPLGGGAVEIVARADIPEGSYTHARARFSRVEVQVERGLVVDGQPVTGRVLVVEPGSDPPLDLPRTVEVEVRDGATASLVIELRSGIWLRRVNRDTRRVPHSEFEGALLVRRGERPPP